MRLPITSLLDSLSFENVEFSADKPFTFEAVFDVQPTFELPEYKNIEIDSEVVPVEDADVAAEVDRICEQSATLEPLEVGQQAEGDFVVVDIDLQVEGESIFSKSEVVMKVGDDFIDSSGDLGSVKRFSWCGSGRDF